MATVPFAAHTYSSYFTLSPLGRIEPGVLKVLLARCDGCLVDTRSSTRNTRTLLSVIFSGVIIQLYDSRNQCTVSRVAKASYQ